jgi:hypothetical protein
MKRPAGWCGGLLKDYLPRCLTAASLKHHVVKDYETLVHVIFRSVDAAASLKRQ